MFVRKHVLMEGAADGSGAGGSGGAPVGAPSGEGGGAGTGAPAPGGSPADPAGGAPAPTAGGGSPGAPAPADPAPKPFFQQLPDSWRKDLASIDEKWGKRLERYTDLPAVIKAGFEAQDRIRRGEISNGLPENPSDEQLTEWRKANGVPESADGYQLQLEQGLVLGDADKAVVEKLYPVAHAANIPAATMSALTSAYLKVRQEEEQAQATVDADDASRTTAVLKEAWKGEFQTNMNLAGNLTNRLPESVRQFVLDARMSNGQALMNSPEVIRWLVDIEREINPAGTVVADANNPVQAIDQEIATLEARMGTDEWHKDKTAQDRYMQLIDARENLRKRRQA